MNSTLHTTSAQIPVADESVTAYGWKPLAGSVIEFSMDGFDMLILGFMLAAISADLGLTSAQAGSLVTWTMLKAVAGGLLFGYLSDRLGRIRVLTWTILGAFSTAIVKGSKSDGMPGSVGTNALCNCASLDSASNR